ncbi:MAG TPA: hypothetical protein VGM54_21375 [Chthoniobacter sp.]
MINLGLPRAFTMAALGLIATTLHATEEFVFWHSQIGGKKYTAGPSWKWIRETPNWIPGQPLPLSVDKAVASAKKELERFAPKDEHWGFSYVDLLSFRSGHKDKWYFLITFGTSLNESTFPQAQIPVNMSGVASPLFPDKKPQVPLSNRKFVSLEERLWERANYWTIPRIEFREATLPQALDSLRQAAAERDPKHAGIPIETGHIPSPDETGLPEARITVSLSDISLAGALRYVASLADCHVVPTPSSLQVRFGPGFNAILTHTIPLAAASKSEIARIRLDPRQYFTNKGVTFTDQTSCAVEDDGGTYLVVKNTAEQLKLIDEALENLVNHRAHKKSE